MTSGNIKAGEFRGKVLTSLSYIETEVRKISDLAKSNEKRITKLETKWAYMAGLGAGLGAAAGVVVNIFIK